MSGLDWIEAINRIESRPDLPVTLQGGEPTLHPDFYEIVNGIKPELNIDLLTNLNLDIYEFARKIHPDRMKRNAPYASIRVSYHPEQMYFRELVTKVLFLQESGFSIGIWAVNHPAWQNEIGAIRQLCQFHNIDFRLKDFLGEYDGKMYGEYKYPDSVGQKTTKTVQCRTSELLIAPDGAVFRCHADLYAERNRIGHIMSNYFTDTFTQFRPCSHYGRCNMCDTKNKTNRFQVGGHTSVEIMGEK